MSSTLSNVYCSRSPSSGNLVYTINPYSQVSKFCTGSTRFEGYKLKTISTVSEGNPLIKCSLDKVRYINGTAELKKLNYLCNNEHAQQTENL
jgi:hypothetical protein